MSQACRIYQAGDGSVRICLKYAPVELHHEADQPPARLAAPQKSIYGLIAIEAISGNR
jgi:hypothetical protein